MGLVALVIYLSLTPKPPELPDAGIDPGHFIAYFALMAWWAQLFGPLRARFVVAVLLVGLGVGLEYAQSFTDYRTFDLDDMRDNAFGVAVAFVLTLTPLGRALLAIEKRMG